MNEIFTFVLKNNEHQFIWVTINFILVIENNSVQLSWN